jgi:hypothetical protein
MSKKKRKINLRLLAIILTVAIISLTFSCTNEGNLKDQGKTEIREPQVASNTEIETKEELIRELEISTEQLEIKEARIEELINELKVAKEKLGENVDLDINLEETKTEEAEAKEVSGIENVFNISIANGSGVSGLARKTAELFKTIKYPNGINKYNITHITNADNFNYENTKIICKSEDTLLTKAAEDIKTILKTGAITTSDEVFKDTDIAIIIGKDFSLPTDVETKTATTEKSIEELKEELKIIKEKLENREAMIYEIREELNNTEELLEDNLRDSYQQIGHLGETIIIYTEFESLAELQKIADLYKEDIYSNESVFQIWFFNDREQAFRTLKNSTLDYEMLVALHARYNYNENTGYEELYYDHEEELFE